MSIIELLQQVGVENVKVQNLAQSLVSAKQRARDCEITFATEPEMGASAMKESAGLPGTHLGLVVWISRSQIPVSKSP